MSSPYQNLSSQIRRRVEQMSAAEYAAWSKSPEGERELEFETLDTMSDFKGKTLDTDHSSRGQKQPGFLANALSIVGTSPRATAAAAAFGPNWLNTPLDKLTELWKSITHDELGLELHPLRNLNQVDYGYIDDAVAKFCKKFQQYVNSDENAAIINDFLTSRGSYITEKNLEIAFIQLFGQLSLRAVVKITEEPTTALSKKDKYGNKVRVPIPATTWFPKPVRSELVETVYTPAQIARLRAEEINGLQQPMAFVETTSSADEYKQSKQFKADTPKSSLWEPKLIQHYKAELDRCMILAPEYAQYRDNPNALKAANNELTRFGLQPSAESFRDAFRSLESQGILGKVRDSDRGIVTGGSTKVKITNDSRPHYTKLEATKKIRGLSPEEYQSAINNDPALREALDRAV
jgi:hypothetical protein